MISIENLSFYRNNLINEKNQLETIINNAPDAHLTGSIRKNGKSEIYLHYHDEPSHCEQHPKKLYVNNDLKPTASQIARKMHAEALYADVTNKIKAIEALIDSFNAPSSEDILVNKKPWLTALLPDKISNNEQLLNWKKQTYERNYKHKEHLIYNTIVPELIVRSKSEADIVSRLEYYGVPYHYDEILNLNGTKISIDFICLNISTGKKWYWDHRGMLDNPDYINKTLFCEKIFLNSGIIQGINLIVTSETSRHPLDILQVDAFIKLFLL